MRSHPTNDEALREQGQVGKTNSIEHTDSNSGYDLFPETVSQVVSASRSTPPLVSGQAAQVLSLIREHQPVLSFFLTADRAIPEAAARVHDLRAAGFNVITTIKSEVVFRGAIRRKAAFYSLGTPEWPAPGFCCAEV